MDDNSVFPVTTAAKRGFTVSYKNKTLLSAVDPIAQALRAVNEAGKLDRTLYVCPSPLLGYGLNELLSLISTDSAVLCVETDKKLFSLSASSIEEKVLQHPRFALVSITDGTELFKYLREKWGARAFRRIETIKLSGGWQLDSACYAEMEDTIRSGFAIDWGNAMTIVKLGRRFMYNVIRNIRLMDQTLPMAELSFGSKPVLVLGAGPSLDTVLDSFLDAGVFDRHKTLNGHAGKKIAVVCVDTCLPVLKARGIVPDLAVILESQFWNLSDFLGSKNSCVPAAVDLTACPPSVQILGGPVYFFCTPWTTLRFFKRLSDAGLMPHLLPPLGSVGLSAVELAMHISSGQIITGGIDFSFTLDSFHARSSPAHLSQLLSRSRFLSSFNTEAVFRDGVFTAFSKSNKPVKSNPAMRTYRNLFENEFSGGRVKDIEGSGLPLGVETLKINDAIKILLNETNNNQNHDEEKQTMVTKQNMHASWTKITNFFKKEKVMLENLRSLLVGDDSTENNTETLDALIDNADYLWAHFPDCAGAEGRRPPVTDLGFLKRVRAEIDPFIKLWKLAERENTV